MVAMTLQERLSEIDLDKRLADDFSAYITDPKLRELHLTQNQTSWMRDRMLAHLCWKPKRKWWEIWK